MVGLEIFEQEYNDSLIENVDKLPISSISSKHLNKIISINGTLKSFTPITPHQKIVYPCKRCDHIYGILINSCLKCHGPIDKIEETKDIITALLEEEYSDNNRIPINVVIKFDKELIKTLNELNLGSKYNIVGKLLIEKKGKSEFFVIEVDSYSYLKEGLEELEITHDDKEWFKVYTNDTEELFERLRNTIFGVDLVGMNDILDSIILMMVSSPKSYTGNKVLRNRGNLMILLVGSPGTGKSQILKRTVAFFPKGRYATCSGSTAIGLVASVQKDDRIGDFVLSPGAVALSHKSICAIDELDKIDKNDLTKLNTMMDSLVIPIDKANIHRKLQADVSILGAMNPKYGTFDEMASISDQINLKKDFLDRFDIIWNVDYFQKKTDSDKITEQSLGAYNVEEEPKRMSIELAQKYFAYAKTINPKLCSGATADIHKEFNRLTKQNNKDNNAYFSRRLLDNMVRIAQACCRLKLKEELDIVDIKMAAEIMVNYLRTIGAYQDGSGLDQYKIEEVLSSDKRKIIDIILKLIKSFNGASVNIKEIYNSLENIDHREIDQLIIKLKNNGEIFEPRKNEYKLG